MPEKKIIIAPEVAAVLAGCRVEGQSVILPQGQLDRKLYEAVDKVLKALGGKWSRTARAHVFTRGLPPDLQAALAAGHVVDQKKTLEQFFTPPAVIYQMFQIIGLQSGEHVLEPSAGEARIVREALAQGAVVTAVEIDESLCEGMLPLHEVHHGRIFIFRDDFMHWTPPGRAPIDVVIMNPPFSRNQDIAHVRRAFDFLRPGGRLISVMSTHWKFASDAPSRDFRWWLGQLPLFEWLDLPEGTFKREGAGVNSGLLSILKRQ